MESPDSRQQPPYPYTRPRPDETASHTSEGFDPTGLPDYTQVIKPDPLLPTFVDGGAPRPSIGHDNSLPARRRLSDIRLEKLGLSKKPHGDDAEAGLLARDKDNEKKRLDDDSSDEDEEAYLKRMEEEWSEDEEEQLATAPCLAKPVLLCRDVCRKSKKVANTSSRGRVIPVLAVLLYTAYFIGAMFYRFGDEGSHRLVGFTVLGVVVVTRHHVIRGLQYALDTCRGGSSFSPTAKRRIYKIRLFLRCILYLALGAVILWTLVDIGEKSPDNLWSLPGLFIFLFICYLMSVRPSKINWHTIYWSIGLQFLSALLILRLSVGTEAILWVQSRLDEFFANSKGASKMLFGDSYMDHYLVFGALPIIFLTSATLSLLYYLGAMQLVVNVVGTTLKFILDTAPHESMGVAAGIFMEGVTALLALKPYLPRMTKSQLFLVITSIFSSLGGAYLAILSSLGISLKFLIPAMIVSAPATFAVCKLMIPETRPNRKCDKNMSLTLADADQHHSILEAFMVGAAQALPLLAQIIVSVFAFISAIAWLNHTTVWLGDRIGVHNLTVEVISSYILYPFSLFMGIDPKDCRAAAMLLGYRTFTANFVAFLKLQEMKANKDAFDQYMVATNFTGPVEYTRDDVILVGLNQTLVNGFLYYERTEAILTYCLCGFSGFLSVAITLGIMTTLVPNRKNWIISISVPALVAGNMANCLTGCFAGIFY